MLRDAARIAFDWMIFIVVMAWAFVVCVVV
jgi:hypothetical protein